jgi:hypothetical protein
MSNSLDVDKEVGVVVVGRGDLGERVFERFLVLLLPLQKLFLRM